MERQKGKINTDQLLNKMSFDCDKMIDSDFMNKEFTIKDQQEICSVWFDKSDLILTKIKKYKPYNNKK
jgi:hypothetical protein